MMEIPQPDNRISLRALQALLRERSLLAALDVFHHALGDIFQMPLPGFRPVMLAGPEANHFLLVEGRGDLRWRVEQDPITRLLRHGVLVEDGDSHDLLRRQMSPALHRRALEQYVEIMWRCTDAVVETWETGATPDMLVEMRRTALLILTESLFAVDFEPEMDRLWQAILRTLRYISPGLWIIWRDVPRPGYGAAIQQLDEYLHGIIALRRAQPGDGQDLLGLLLSAGLPDAAIRDQLLTLFIAGHDTSTALLAWALYLLSSHPDVLARAREEVDCVLGSQPPEMSRIAELTYLGQVINETLRLYPPIHLGSRMAAAELDFQGYCIPAGTRVLYSIYLTHRDPKIWPDPAVFRPERFAPEAVKAPPYAYLPFGGGPRNCIGTAFAQLEAKVVLARILQRFDLQFVGPAVRMRMGATLEPTPGVQVSVKRRCQARTAGGKGLHTA